MFERLLSLIVCTNVACAAWGQVVDKADQDWNERIRQMSFLDRTGEEHKLGAGDLIEISVFGVEDFRYKLRINSRGQITLPFVGTVEAAGLTPAELEQDLKVRFEPELIKDAQVSVFVSEYRSQPVFVLGAVRQPGQYQLIHPLNLVDVLAMAGGVVQERAAEEVIMQKRSQNGATTRRIDLRALLEEGDLSQNVPVSGGDVIHVPERKRDLFYVVGEVNRSGAFEIPVKNEVFVSQAIAWAGGPMRTAKMDKGILVRYDGQGGRQELVVNFKSIVEGKKPDFLVQPDDIIFIPGSTAKTIGYGLLGIIPTTVSGAILAGPIVR